MVSLIHMWVIRHCPALALHCHPASLLYGVIVLLLLLCIVMWLHCCVLARHHPMFLLCRCSMVSVSSTCIVVLCAIIVTCDVVHHLVVSEGG